MKSLRQIGTEILYAGTIATAGALGLAGCTHQPDLNNKPKITAPGPESNEAASAEPPKEKVILTEREIIEKEIEECLAKGLGTKEPEEQEETKIYEEVDIQEARAVLVLLNDLMKHIGMNSHAGGFHTTINGCQYEARGSYIELEKRDEEDRPKEFQADPLNVLPYGRVIINKWVRDPDSAGKDENHEPQHGINHSSARFEWRTGPGPGDFEILLIMSESPNDPNKPIKTNTAATLTAKDGKVSSHNFETMLALVERLEEIYRQEKDEDAEEIRKF